MYKRVSKREQKHSILFFHCLRQIIYEAKEEELRLTGKIEVDESYFDSGSKGKRGRGASGKVSMFGLLKPGGTVYAKVIPDTKNKSLLGIIQDLIVSDSIVYSNGYHSYNVLEVSEFKQYRINH